MFGVVGFLMCSMFLKRKLRLSLRNLRSRQSLLRIRFGFGFVFIFIAKEHT